MLSVNKNRQGLAQSVKNKHAGFTQPVRDQQTGFTPLEKSRPKVAEATRQKRGRSLTGFTLIELIIVLAISSLLAIILFVGQGSRLERARFTDAMERIVTEFEQVKTEADATVGISGTNTGRIVFGKSVTFNGSLMNVDTLTAQNTGNCIQNVLPEAPTKIIEIPWGAEFEDTSAGKAVVFGRAPHNGILKTYVFTDRTLVTAGNCDIGDLYGHHAAIAPQIFRFVSVKGYTADVTVTPDGAITLEYVN